MKLFLFAFAVIAAAAADVRPLPTSVYLSPTESSSQSAPLASSDAVQQQAEQGELLQNVEYTTPETTQSPVSEAVQVHNQTSTEATPAHEVQTDGYHYKTNRRVVYRRLRRDVSHLPSSSYLPPGQNGVAVEVPTHQYLAPAPEHVQVTADAAVPEVAQTLSETPASEATADGYHYKTQRRVVFRRQRRDVSHLPSNEYLPPAQEGTPVVVPSNEYLPSLSANPANNYAGPVPAYAPINNQASLLEVAYVPGQATLPEVEQAHSHAPVSEVTQVLSQAPVSEVSQIHNQAFVPEEDKVHSHVSVPEVMLVVNPVEAEPAHELAADGYHYKTHRRVVYRRQRRDVSHLASNEYLPPVQGEDSVEVPTNKYLPSVPQLAIETTSMKFPEVKQVHSRVSAPEVMLVGSPAPVLEVEQNLVHEAVPIPVKDVPVVVAPVEVVPVEVAPVKVAPVEVVPLEVAPVKDVSVEVAPVQVSPVQVSPVQVSPVQVSPVDAALVKDVSVEVAPGQVASVKDVPAEVAPVVVDRVEVAPAHELTADGYHYKTQRRVVYRRH